ncbi:MAG: 2-succinyl-5-enolpyruvyl-6-hydroxy-3-cyclohexene-1-carboxylic-acid synthase [Flavobacteriales bacterium]|nr:2-succinyl-5-enolpyruvyl-6-hydroxy-3-cyclohexene-1-carboxylic-acid synthase [Flavobacteriales bacterium]MDP4731598.1 2-succinyl-5-enolpyruvyl-6-hydroxy-3-cyclohexene-1-carboxylic-acid synthase [Flavobacteriales bacterium]
MKISSKKVVSYILGALKSAGITDVVLTPGSRNAPFSISIANTPFFETYSIVDERSAAFFALGLSQQSKNPTVLICTSGTALLNYAPAIAEAYYQRIPLLVISADRPEELIDRGEGQSIRQNNVFQNYADFSACLIADEKEGSIRNEEIIQNTFQFLISNNGPVHLNVPFQEPLYELIECDELPSFQFERKENSVDVLKEIGRSLELLQESERIMVLVGQHIYDDFSTELKEFNQLNQVVVLTESHANVNIENSFPCIDRLIMGLGGNAQQMLAPDVLITVGTNIISRKIKAILRKVKPKHIQVGVNEKPMDTFDCLEVQCNLTPQDFFNSLNEIRSKSEWKNDLISIQENQVKQVEAWLPSAVFSDLTVFSSILNSIPNGTDLQMGNSSVVRYIQLFNQNKKLTYFGNRGVAGIDGSTSSAIGAAWKTKKPTLLISGDLSFHYDSNAFWNNYVSSQLKVIVINNGGGGIFRIIDGSKDTEHLQQFFETSHSSKSIKGIAELYHLNYFSATNNDELNRTLPLFFKEKSVCVLEIFTHQEDNPKALDAFFQHTQRT